MKKAVIAIVVITFIALTVAGILFLLKKRNNEDAWLCQNGVWLKRGNPSKPMPLEPCPVQNNSGQLKENKGDQKPIGGDQDEHGCLTAAGYSWCESKQKCLRNWEEICPPN